MRTSHLRPAVFASTVGLTALAACGAGHGTPPAASAGSVAHWRPALHVSRVVDLAAGRADGRFVVAAGGRLALLRPGGRPRPFARGPGGYATQRGPEPYIPLSRGQVVRGAACRFPRDGGYALEPQVRPGVIAVTRAGRAGRPTWPTVCHRAIRIRAMTRSSAWAGGRCCARVFARAIWSWRAREARRPWRSGAVLPARSHTSRTDLRSRTPRGTSSSRESDQPCTGIDGGLPFVNSVASRITSGRSPLFAPKWIVPGRSMTQSPVGTVPLCPPVTRRTSRGC